MQVKMPQLGETVIEGTILKWLKQEGDQVGQDEPLFEISTDKVDTEVPSPAAGTLTKILVPEGQTVSVGTDLAEISEAGGAAGDAAPGAPSPLAAEAPVSAPAATVVAGGDEAPSAASPAAAAGSGRRVGCGAAGRSGASVADPVAARAEAGRASTGSTSRGWSAPGPAGGSRRTT